MTPEVGTAAQRPLPFNGVVADGSRRSTRQAFLSFSPPTIGQEEIAEVVEALRSGWLTTGPKTARFEQEFGSRIGAPAALAVNSGTAAMHLGLLAMGAGGGHEIITTPMTFASSVHVIEHVGARPILVDVEPDTLNIDPDRIAAAVTARTRGVLAVHYAGHPAELDPIIDLAGRHGLGLLEDAAHALPAAYRNRIIGSGPNPVAFSFYATKNLTTGEGGMLTGFADLVDRARSLSLHGMSRDAWQRYAKGGRWYYEVLEAGWKYNMSDIQAGLGIAQLKKLDRHQRRRREIVAAYREAFADCPALELPVERAHVEHAWHLYVLRLRLEALNIDRDRFIDELTARQIGTSVHFIPIHLHPYYRDKYGYHATDFPVAYDAYRRMVSLPLHPALSDADVGDVAAAVLDVVERHRR